MPGTTTVAAPAVGFHELGFNCWKSPKSKGNPLLRDPVIRQAVHWAIDKQKIVATSMAGLAEPGTSLISTAQGDWHWEVPEAGQYRYDPARAKQILEDAGLHRPRRRRRARERRRRQARRSVSSPSTSTPRTRRPPR